jgi:hypothetical protein
MDSSGSNLPVDPKICSGSWKYESGIEISKDIYSLIGANPKKILEAIEIQGYYIASNKNPR